MTPMDRARAGLAPAGMFRHRTLPWSIKVSSGGMCLKALLFAEGCEFGSGCCVAGLGGQKTEAISGRSNMERKTEIPSTMLVRTFVSSFFQSLSCHRRIAWTVKGEVAGGVGVVYG